ncbi:hypothetical protein L249_5870 [Ophiocordyceps polyrhachis-furcata BCC 54312]|uniref:Uncharacterized protein n=1 Tax=Ophiocordyceps polyrhachis-furcata BCC 54312 TaxID=1330021 RepID=A0A367L0D5_9HYPO|nr:hypothetical protein L249_5870 [Ophiocordyceps polyrhachis-furcata BCC 54312]
MGDAGRERSRSNFLSTLLRRRSGKHIIYIHQIGRYQRGRSRCFTSQHSKRGSITRIIQTNFFTDKESSETEAEPKKDSIIFHCGPSHTSQIRAPTFNAVRRTERRCRGGNGGRRHKERRKKRTRNTT